MLPIACPRALGVERWFDCGYLLLFIYWVLARSRGNIFPFGLQVTQPVSLLTVFVIANIRKASVDGAYTRCAKKSNEPIS